MNFSCDLNLDMHARLNLLLRIGDIDNNITCLVLRIDNRTYGLYFALENLSWISAELQIHFPAYFHLAYFTLQNFSMDAYPIDVYKSKKLPAACYMLLGRNFNIVNYA
ncbi:hypothetical protein ES703_102229 [subsurface metagenome]